jgi:LmeA-like phospholipid-binding
MFLLSPILRPLLVLAAIVAALAVGAELLARKLIGDAVAHAVSARIGTSPKVAFGSTPLLVQIAHGRLDDVTVSARHARIGGVGGLALRGTLRDVHITSLLGLRGVIGSSRFTATASAASVRPLLDGRACARALPAAVLAGLGADPRIEIRPGRIELLPRRGRSAEVRMRPIAAGSTLRFEISTVELASATAGAPAAELTGTRAGSSCSRSFTNLPFGVSLVSAAARRGALELGFAGSGVSFSAIG